VGTRSGIPVATAGNDAISVSAWNAGEPRGGDGEITGTFELVQGAQAVIVLGAVFTSAVPANMPWPSPKSAPSFCPSSTPGWHHPDGRGGTPLLEAPGFLMLNYRRRAPLASIVAHVVYGAIVGGFISLAG